MTSKGVELSTYGTLFQLKPVGQSPFEVISAGNDHDIKVWDVRTGTKVRQYQGSESSVVDVFERNGYYAYCQADGIISLAKSEENILRVQLKVILANPKAVPLSIIMINDDVLVGACTNQIVCLSVDDLSVRSVFFTDILQWPTQLGTIHNQLLVFAKGTIEIWKKKNNYTHLENKDVGVAPIMTYSHLNDYLALGFSDGLVKVFKMENGFQTLLSISTFQLKSALVQVTIFEKDGKTYIGAGCFDPDILIVDLENNQQKIIQKRAAPFFLFEGGMMSRVDTVTRYAMLDYDKEQQ